LHTFNALVRQAEIAQDRAGDRGKVWMLHEFPSAGNVLPFRIEIQCSILDRPLTIDNRASSVLRHCSTIGGGGGAFSGRPCKKYSYFLQTGNICRPIALCGTALPVDSLPVSSTPGP